MVAIKKRTCEQISPQGHGTNDATIEPELTSTAKRRRIALQSLLEAARAPGTTGRRYQVPTPGITAAGSDPDPANVDPGEAGSDGLELEYELARIISEATNVAETTAAVAASNCKATGDGQGVGSNNNSNDDSCPTGPSGAVGGPSVVEAPVVTYSEKRRVLCGDRNADMASKRARVAPRDHPALSRSAHTPLPEIVRLGYPSSSRDETGDNGALIVTGDKRRRGHDDSDSDADLPNWKKYRATLLGTTKWRPIHLPRQRRKATAAKMKLSATQATLTSLGGGQGD